MRHILVSSLLLFIAISTYSQTDNPPQACTLKLSQAPAVRGVKLGMTADELLQLFPGSGESNGIKGILSSADGYPKFGETSFNLNPSDWGSPPRFAGIGYFYFRFFDRRVVLFEARYEHFPSGARWPNPDELIQRFSNSFHLPGPKEWVTDSGSADKRLKCDGFDVVVTAGDWAGITFYTRSWEGAKKERQAAFEEQKRREFNP